MRTEFTIPSNGAGQLHCCRWTPEGQPKAVLQIVHGIAEYIERYDEFASYLNGLGYLVVAEDHMGHGGTVGDEGTQGYFDGGWPEKGLLKLRAAMEVYSNNRPAKIWPQLAGASPLKPEIVEKGIDFMIVRELTGGIYFGSHETKRENGQAVATDILTYSEAEIRRIGRIGFETARKRRKKLCSVEKSNVLDSSRLWKKIMHELSEEYPDVTLTDMLVDNCAMQIVKDPSQFDVIVTENMFGDILSDEASMITGSIGTIPSSSLGSTTRGLYEPIHGSAPDIAGQDIANPIGTILAAAMLLRYSFDMAKEADAIEKSVSDTLDAGFRTADILPPHGAFQKVGCKQMGAEICARIQ